MVALEDGITTEAEIESYGQTADGELIDPEKNFQKVYGARAYKTIMSLRAKIADILEGFGIAVLRVDEWKKPVPWLRGSEETLIGFDGKASLAAAVRKVLDEYGRIRLLGGYL